MAMSKALFCLLGASSLMAVAADKDIVTFDGAQGTTFNWQTRDDPVMGGSSKSNWQMSNKRGSWAGEVKIVWFLQAAGFCHAEATNYHGDWSSVGADGSVVVHYRVNSKSTKQDLAHFGLEFHSGH